MMTKREIELAVMRAKIKRQVKIDKADREANLKKWQPRYDELYFEAVAWLDENG